MIKDIIKNFDSQAGLLQPGGQGGQLPPPTHTFAKISPNFAENSFFLPPLKLVSRQVPAAVTSIFTSDKRSFESKGSLMLDSVFYCLRFLPIVPVIKPKVWIIKIGFVPQGTK